MKFTKRRVDFSCLFGVVCLSGPLLVFPSILASALQPEPLQGRPAEASQCTPDNQVPSKHAAGERTQQLIQQGDVAEARNQLTLALKRFPNEGGFYSLLGVVEAQQGSFREAESNFKKAIERAPGLTAAYLDVGRLYEGVVDRRLASRVAPARLALGDALLRANHPEAAVSEPKAAADLEPRMRQAFTLLVRAYQKLGKSDENRWRTS